MGKGEYICGMYGICLDDDAPEGYFKYMIADDYTPAKELPEEFETVVIIRKEIRMRIIIAKFGCRLVYAIVLLGIPLCYSVSRGFTKSQYLYVRCR